MNACIVGYGMIDGAGMNPEACWTNMINDKDLHMPLESIYTHSIGKRISSPLVIYPQDIPGDPTISRAIRYALHTTEQALLMSNLPSSENVATVFSSVVGSNDIVHALVRDNIRIKPKVAVTLPHDVIPSFISMKYGFRGINVALESACSTGIVTIDYATRILDEYDYVVVGGADAGINGISLEMFSSIRALGTRSMPFDRNRDGFVMGEGSGCIILQSESKAKEFGSKIYARITGIATASDASDMTSPSGTGARRALSKLDLSNIDAVNAHGTSTPIGDSAEYDVVREFTDAPIYSNKGKIGHTLAAAGILETIYSVMSIEHNIIPHTANCIDSEMDVVQSNIETKVNKVLNNSFGFGGKCASMIIESA